MEIVARKSDKIALGIAAFAFVVILGIGLGLSKAPQVVIQKEQKYKLLTKFNETNDDLVPLAFESDPTSASLESDNFYQSAVNLLTRYPVIDGSVFSLSLDV